MEISIEKFNYEKDKAEEHYRSIGSIYCPYFKEEVSFNAKGLEHLKFKERGKARVVKDQYVRLRLLKLAPEIIKKSHTLQEYYEINRFEKVNSNSRWKKKMVRVVYYGFVAIINEVRIKIIVKEVDNGKMFFWSLIPFWKNYQKNSGNKKILHLGNMEND